MPTTKQKAARDRNWKIHQVKMMTVVVRQNVSHQRARAILALLEEELRELYHAGI